MQLSPDGRFYLDAATNSWQPVPPQAPAPPPPQAPADFNQQLGYAQPQTQQQSYAPPPPPAYGGQVGYAQPTGVPGQALPPRFGTAPPPTASGAPLAALYPQGFDFAEIAGPAALDEGDYILRIDDVEAAQSKANNDKAQFKGTVTHGPLANRTHIWSRVLTEKAVWRLGKDLVALGLGVQPNGARWATDPTTLTAQLNAVLRGRSVKISVRPQIDRDTKLPSAEGYTETRVTGWADQGSNGQTAAQPAAVANPPSAYAPVAVAPSAPPPTIAQVSYPAAPPPPNAAPAPPPPPTGGYARV